MHSEALLQSPREASPPSLNWLQRLLELCRLPRNTPGTATKPVGGSRVSSSALLSARRALQWPTIVPGGAKVMATIDVALEIVKGFSVVSTSSDSACLPYDIIIISHFLDHVRSCYGFVRQARRIKKVLRRLEYQVLCLVELLEPIPMMRRHHISLALQSQVLTLRRWAVIQVTNPPKPQTKHRA